MRANLKVICKKGSLNGIYGEIAEIIGEENAKLLYEEYRGQQISFPVELYSRQFIYDSIISEYDGTNIKQLATKYEYSERTIRRIIKSK